ncbi:electron transfer flavoprotein subunit beta, partial [Candidatus Bipolaricaulota bacterium]|nr:electron transfer flavoprotein subunit beta [Candidatus Bipolaricaulota bacterium]
MEFLVFIKQVPDTDEVKVDEESGTIIREGVPSILNPFDEYALNLALRLKEEMEEEVNITTMSMGPPQAKDALKKCLAIGADRGILLSDKVFGGADTWATSFT